MAATILFTMLDTTAKWLSVDMGTAQIVWARMALHLLVVMALLIATGRADAFRTRHPVMQTMRSVLLVVTTALNFIAIRYLQLAETISIFFVAPLLIAALAGPTLGEWPGPRRWAAILCGFIGVLVVTRPGMGGFSWPALLVLGAAVTYAAYSIYTRRVSGDDSSYTSIFYAPIAGVIGFAPLAFAQWTPPGDLVNWALLLSTGFFGGLGHFLLIVAYGRAPAPVLAPFLYGQIIWMVIAGYAVFGDVPDPLTLVGAAIVIASGIYLRFRELKVAGG
jgi:drug/metabolite transporter (DMT)-like permease